MSLQVDDDDLAGNAPDERGLKEPHPNANAPACAGAFLAQRLSKTSLLLAHRKIVALGIICDRVRIISTTVATVRDDVAAGLSLGREGSDHVKDGSRE